MDAKMKLVTLAGLGEPAEAAFTEEEIALAVPNRERWDSIRREAVKNRAERDANDSKAAIESQLGEQLLATR